MPLSFLAAALAVSLAAVDAPITAVTVFSDQARVTRSASVAVSGTQPFELPLLPRALEPSTLRVEVTGAEVRRVELEPVEATEVPLDEGRALLTQLEKQDDALRQTRLEKAAYDAELEAVRRLSPAPPPADPLKPPPRLDPSGWRAAATFVADETAKLEARSRELGDRVEQLSRERDVFARKAQLLGAARRGGYRVRVLVAGDGPARLAVTYVIGGARWLPSYDLQLDPGTGKVRVAFAGLVSQWTGEDWEDAQLTLSTAVPTTSTVMPRFATWKIGERDRFIPTPSLQEEPPLPPPPARPPPTAAREGDVLREQLLAVASRTPQERSRAGDRDKDEAQQEEARVAAPELQPPQESELADQPMAPPPPPPPVLAAPASAAQRPGMAGGLSNDVAAPSRPRRGSPRPGVASPAGGLAPPSGFSPPAMDPELPASLAGGYALAFLSLRPETLRSGHGARRVALFSETWPVTVERKVFPALAPEAAFLVAELKSPSSRMLPGGHAHLFVGEDPAGDARLKLVAPGEAFTLPLGLDRAIKPSRNVKLSQAERGLIGQDDVTEYTVTDELANPYALPVRINVFDQWPVSFDKDVEVTLLKTEPYALQDKARGSLEWNLTVPASSRMTVSFTYRLRRPKGWRMHQEERAQ